MAQRSDTFMLHRVYIIMLRL